MAKLKGGLEVEGNVFSLGTDYEKAVVKAKEELDDKRLLLSAAYEARGENWWEAERQTNRYARYVRPDNVDYPAFWMKDSNGNWFYHSVKRMWERLQADATERREFAESEMRKADELVQQYHKEYDEALLNLIEKMGEWFDYLQTPGCVGRAIQVVKIKTYHKTFCRWVYGYKQLVGSELVL